MVEVSGIKGGAAMARVLRALPGKIEGRLLANAVRAGARVVRKAAKARVPVKTGKLRDSLMVKKVRQRQSSSVLVIVGPKWPEGAHGHLVEFGTKHSAAKPFLRPAFDEKAGEALDKIGDTLGRGIERAAAKLAGSFAKSGLGRRRRR